MDAFEQIAMAVKESAVDSGAASDGTAGPEPARGAATVDMLTTSAAIEVSRTVSRDGCIFAIFAACATRHQKCSHKSALLVAVTNLQILSDTPS